MQERGKDSNPFLQKQRARRRLDTEPIGTVKDLFAAQPGLADHTAHGAALVRRALVAEEHGARLNDPLGGIVEDTEVGVEAWHEVALGLVQTDLGGGVGAAEAHDVLEGLLGCRGV